jgi:hypothetical protein
MEVIGEERASIEEGEGVTLTPNFERVSSRSKHEADFKKFNKKSQLSVVTNGPLAEP